MIDKNVEKKECCGCFVCENVCPNNCIKMVGDKEGFWYPEVDYNKCITCNLCVIKCPALGANKIKKTTEDAIILAAYSKNEETRKASTSGGIFSEIAAEILRDKNGVVFGAKYDNEHMVEHEKISKISELKLLRQSKYVQSNMKKVYKEAKLELERGKNVLFVGTPCHIAGLRMFLGREYENLYTIDFLCRGVISPEVYRQYLKSLEKKYNSKIEKIIFKDKTYGWHRFSSKIVFKNGNTYIKDRYNDSYMRGYLEGNLYLRPSCHLCKYKTLPRYADITLGDFWGIEKVKPHLDQDRGTSIFMINTRKGEEIFQKIKEQIIYEKMGINDIYIGNSALTEKTVFPNKKKREYFFANYLNKDFEELVRKILHKNIVLVIIKKVIKSIIK